MNCRFHPCLALGALALALLISGCQSPTSHAPSPRCGSGEPMYQTTLYFGLSRPTGTAVTEAEWQQFVDDQVTPRFREGLTVFSSQGQWLGNNGEVVREKSKALMLIHGTDARSQQNVDALRTAYQQRFQQESVMRVDTPVCVAF